MVVIYLRHTNVRLLLALVVLVASAGVLVPLPVTANNFGQGNFGACQYGSCSITISTSSTVNLNVTPTPGGTCTVQSNAVLVTTYSSNGYTLTLNNSTTNTALVSGTNTVGSVAATQASPTALISNSWGYRVDGIGGFGTGPTSPISNGALNAIKFAAVPASNATADTLATTSSPAGSGSTTTVWYGICANTASVNGTYTTSLTYTAVAN